MIALALLASLVLQETPHADRKGLIVPSGPEIELDGRLGAEEWKGALRQPLGAQGELLLRRDEHNLYLGLRGPTQAWAHVYVTAGDTVVVRHASAALGTALYRRDEHGKWQPVQTFPERDAWALRDPALTPEMRAARQAFLAKEGWVASNNSMGKNECEVVLARRKLDEEVRVAVAFISNPAAPLVWPVSLADACVQPTLLMGTTPADLVFRPETWGLLELEPPAVPDKAPK